MGPATSTPMVKARVTTMANPSRRWATRRLSTNRSVAIRNVYGSGGPQGRPAPPGPHYPPAWFHRRRASAHVAEPDAPQRHEGLLPELAGMRRPDVQDDQNGGGSHVHEPQRRPLVRREPEVL